MNSSTFSRALAPLILGSLAAAPLMAGGGSTGITTRVSLTEDGASVSENCSSPAISADGRYVAFATIEPLIPADDNGHTDIYVQDRETGSLVCASVDFWGNYVTGTASHPSISADGRCIAYETTTSDIGLDFNGTSDVVFIDLDEGIPRLVSTVNGSIVAANNASGSPSISADGRHVAFESVADNVLPGDTNGTWDVFVRDTLTDSMSLASIGFVGQANAASYSPSISGDGQRVAFQSLATNLAFMDDNGAQDVFVHRFDSGSTQMLSRSITGDPGDDASIQAHISTDGQIVLFRSAASDLVPNDLNGYADAFYAVVGQVGVHLVSAGLDGTPATGSTTYANLSPDGRYAIFRNASPEITLDHSSILEIYLRDLETSKTWLVSRPSGASDLANGAVGTGAVASEDGRHVAFLSDATNLDPADNNGVTDIYVRTTFEDPTPYCLTMTTVAGCEPTIRSTGIPSASADSGFTIFGTNVAPDKPALLFYGFQGRKQLPFMGGTHCVKGATKRSRLLRSTAIGAGPCDGLLSLDMNAFAAGAIPGNPQPALSLIGQTVNAQFWGRDPGSAFGVFLTNAIEYVVGP